MDIRLDFKTERQPTETTCGPSCLHAVYNYYGDHVSLRDVIDEVEHLEEGGTLAVFLACHALGRGYRARIYTYNLKVFDPSWFTAEGRAKPELAERLALQAREKADAKLRTATRGYLDFLRHGGEIRFEDLTTGLIRRYLKRSVPLVTGLSATYLHRSPREAGPLGVEDDARGEPVGHFVVLYGYNMERRTVLVADPLDSSMAGAGAAPNHTSSEAGIDRVVCSILLGVLTYDANFLVIEPKGGREAHGHSGTDRS